MYDFRTVSPQSFELSNCYKDGVKLIVFVFFPLCRSLFWCVVVLFPFIHTRKFFIICLFLLFHSIPFVFLFVHYLILYTFVRKILFVVFAHLFSLDLIVLCLHFLFSIIFQYSFAMCKRKKNR